MQPWCDQWSPSHGLFNTDILLCTPLAHPSAPIILAHAPPSSLSLATFPTGTPHAQAASPTGAPLLTCAHVLATSCGSRTCLGSRGLLPACSGVQTSSGLTNQSTSLPSSGFSYTFSNDVIKTQPWGEPQPSGEGPLPRLSFLA